MRHLILVLGDQLDPNSAAFDEFDSKTDAVWMAEVDEEATYVKAHKQRLWFFFSCMRHFRDELRGRGDEVHYHELTHDPRRDRGRTHVEVLEQDLTRLRPSKVIVVEPGDWRIERQLIEYFESANVEFEIRPDRHFFCSRSEFAAYARGRKSLTLEYFYRELRKRHDVLMCNGEPEGGEWNFDRENRDAFSASGPDDLPTRPQFDRDEIAADVASLIESRYADHPGELGDLNLPVTREQARTQLDHFIADVLPRFGRYEDAMWSDEPFLYHSRLSAALNVKLLDPRECVAAAVNAYDSGDAPIESVEGFVRQILGWREFVRGVYWHEMPDYLELNALDQNESLPRFFWDGKSEMECVRQSMGHVLRYGYAHHIHRLMVLGNIALLTGVNPRVFHDWHMAMYVDAIDWVSLPNTLGMSQFGDGGIVGTKPYCASGNYINKMSNFCKSCRFDYRKRTGEDACPFTTLYWDFLDRQYDRLKHNRRMTFQIKNLEKLRKQTAELQAIKDRAAQLRLEWTS